MIDDVGYDPELFDAEIHVDNTTTEQFFTVQELAAYFGHRDPWVYAQIKLGVIPAARWPSSGAGDPARWTRAQLIHIVAGMLERGEKVPA